MEEAIKDPFPLTFGSYEDALKLIGKKSAAVVAEFSVTREMIKLYCSLVEDANASYWNEAYADKQWGGVVAPPGMLLVWPMPLLWHPSKEQIHYFLSTKIPLPGKTLINVSTETEFFKHLYVGDRVSVVDQLIEISEEKTTRIGRGHFLKTRAEFVNQNSELIAVHNNSLFRFDALEPAL